MVKIYSTQKYIAFCISFLFAVAIITSCKKNADAVATDNGNPPDLSNKVKSSASGFVTDENDNAVNLTTVQVGATIVTTDKYGYFEVKNVDVVKDAAVVTVTKTGYFKAIKTYMAEEGKAAFFRIKLMPKTNAGTINAATGGVVTLTNGLSITMPAGAVVNATTNSVYTGTVNVTAKWLDPTAVDLSSIMPGDLRGINTNGNVQLLTTYGMAAIELTGSGGELLQIATGKKATLSLPIPSSISSSAPATIPLWYFDEAKGLWKEEGSATKTGNNYVGEVGHFSFWNVDVPGNFVQFDCTVKTTAGQPVQNAFVKITVINNPANSRGGITDTSGYVRGAIPANAQLLLEIFVAPFCTTVVYSQIFTTTNLNLSLGTITVNNPAYQANVIGTVTTCANTPVTNGYIIVNRGNQYYRYNITMGNFLFNTVLCSPSENISIIAEDISNLQQSIPYIFTINSGNNVIGNIQACGITAQKSLLYTVNGVPYNLISPPDSIMTVITGVPLRYFLECRNNSVNNWNYADVFFEGTNIALGSTQPLVAFGCGQFQRSQNFNTPIFVTITEYGNIGQYVSGNFSGGIIGPPPTNTVYNVACRFRALRRF